MEGCCLDLFIKTVNVRSFYDNGGGYVHQYNDMVREFHLYLFHSKLQNTVRNTARIYILLARMSEKKMIRGGTMRDQTDGCAKQ